MLDEDARLWYMNEAATEGWSVRTLDRNISTQYYYRLMQSPKKDIFYYLVVSRRDYMNDIAHDMRSQTMYDMCNLKIVTFDRLEENVRKLANNHPW